MARYWRWNPVFVLPFGHFRLSFLAGICHFVCLLSSNILLLLLTSALFRRLNAGSLVLCAYLYFFSEWISEQGFGFNENFRLLLLHSKQYFLSRSFSVAAAKSTALCALDGCCRFHCLFYDKINQVHNAQIVPYFPHVFFPANLRYQLLRCVI